MRKLRLLLLSECNRRCPMCCNKNYDLDCLPKIASFSNWDEVYMTGGEPMLDPKLIVKTAYQFPRYTKVVVYTAKVDNLADVIYVLRHVNGLTVTLHEQRDVQHFVELNRILLHTQSHWSLRLNVFAGVQLPENIDLSLWQVQSGMIWVKDCPVPSGEIFMRL